MDCPTLQKPNLGNETLPHLCTRNNNTISQMKARRINSFAYDCPLIVLIPKSPQQQQTRSIYLHKTKYKLTALLIFAFRYVLPHAFRFGTLGCYGACGVFVVGTLSGVEEKDEAFLVLLH